MPRLGPLPAAHRPAVGAVAALAIVLAGALGGCGEQGAPRSAEHSSAGGPAATGSSPGSPRAPAEDGGVAVEHVQLVSESVAGGVVSPVAAPLLDDADVATFTEQFEGEAMPTAVLDAAAGLDVPDGAALYGAVVAVGCDAPDEVLVTAEGAEVVVTPVKEGGPEEQCFAPVTTVALVVARR